MAETGFNASVKELLSGLDGFISSKTVTGEPIAVHDTVIIPFMEVSLGVGAGAYGGKGQGTAGGLGAKMTPSAVLLLSEKGSRLISIKEQDTVLKVLDMVPEVIDRLKALGKKEDPDVKAEVDRIVEEAKAPSEND